LFFFFFPSSSLLLLFDGLCFSFLQGNVFFTGISVESLEDAVRQAKRTADRHRREVVGAWKRFRDADPQSAEEKRADTEHVELKKLLFTRHESAMVAFVLLTPFFLKEQMSVAQRHALSVIMLWEKFLLAWIDEQIKWHDETRFYQSRVCSETMARQDWLCTGCGRELSNIFFLEKTEEFDPESVNMDTLCPDDVEVWCFKHFDRNDGVTIFFRILAPLSLKEQLENNVSSALAVQKRFLEKMK